MSTNTEGFSLRCFLLGHSTELKWTRREQGGSGGTSGTVHLYTYCTSCQSSSPGVILGPAPVPKLPAVATPFWWLKRKKKVYAKQPKVARGPIRKRGGTVGAAPAAVVQILKERRHG